MVFFLLPVLIAVPVLLVAVVLSVVFLVSPGSSPPKKTPSPTSTAALGSVTASILSTPNITTSYFASTLQAPSETLSGSALLTFDSTAITTRLETTLTTRSTDTTGTTRGAGTSTASTLSIVTQTSTKSTEATKTTSKSAITKINTAMRSPMTVVPADASRLSSQEPSLTSKTRTKFAIPSCIVPTHKSRGGLDYAHRHKQPSEKDLVHKPSQKPMDVEENGGGDDDDGDDEDTELKLEPRIDCDTTVDDATDGRPEDGKRGWEHMEKRDDATKGNKQMLAKQGTFAKDMAKLERWITKAVERQSVRHEAKLRKVFSNILRNEEAPQHLQALKKLAWQQSRPQRGLIQNVIPVNPGADKMLGPPQINTSIGNDGGNNDQNILLILLDSLLQPFILQTRADIRNIVIWLCAGAPGSKIDGRINGSDEFSSKALQEDVMAIFHPNGSHSLGDIIDPRIVPMVLGCLKSRLQDFVSQLDTLLWERLGQGKEFLLQRVAALTGVPRFLIPLSEEPRKDEGPSLMGQSVDQEHQLLVESQQELPSEYKGRDDIQSQMEALGWVVDTVINELKSLAVDDALPKSKIKKGASSRIGSRQRANSARQQQGHHHHREMGAERQRLQIPWAQDGPTKPHEDKNVGMCGWIQDRLG